MISRLPEFIAVFGASLLLSFIILGEIGDSFVNASEMTILYGILFLLTEKIK